MGGGLPANCAGLERFTDGVYHSMRRVFGDVKTYFLISLIWPVDGHTEFEEDIPGFVLDRWGPKRDRCIDFDVLVAIAGRRGKGSQFKIRYRSGTSHNTNHRVGR